jgi:putative heme-binding domain-containing protein
MNLMHSFKKAWILVLLAPAFGSGQAVMNPFAGSPQAVEDGKKLFGLSCAPCHGRDGAGAQGQAEGMRPPDLTRGAFKYGKRDEDLFRVISEGVRGSEMPSFTSLGTEQIWRVIAFVRSLSVVASTGSGNATAGEALFWNKGNCGSCHEMAGRGTRMGPDLSRNSRRSNPQNLKSAIVDPNADVASGFAVLTVVTKDGKKISGLERWLDNFSARLIDQSGHEQTYLRDEITSVDRELRSTMPDNYGKLFSATELTDLMAYINKVRNEAASQ